MGKSFEPEAYDKEYSLLSSRSSGITTRNIILAVALNLTFIFTAFVLLKENKKSADQLALTAVMNLSQSLEGSIDDFYDKIDLTLQTLADEIPPVISGGKKDKALVNKLISRQRNRLPILSALRATDAAGNLIYGVEDNSTEERINISDREYFIRLREDNKAGLLISDPLKGRITGKLAIVLARRINLQDGTFAGIVFASVPLDYFSKLFASIKLGSKGSIGFRDRQMRLIVRYPSFKGTGEAGSTKIADEFTAAIRTNPNSGSYTVGQSSIDGVRRLHYYRRNDAYGFIINAGAAHEDYLANWHSLTWKISLLLALFVSSSTAFVWRQHRSLKQQDLISGRLVNSEERFRSFVENIDDIVFSLTTEGVFKYVSPNWRDAFGYELDETVGKPFLPFVHPDDIPVCISALNQVVSTGERRKNIEYRVLCKDGSYIWYSANGSLLHDRMSGEASFLGIGRDISEQRKVEGALRRSESHYHSIFDTSLIGVAVTDRDFNYIDVNEALCRMLGYKKEELVGRTGLADVTHPDDLNEGIQVLNKLKNGEIDHYVIKKRYVCKNGNILTTMAYAKGKFSPEGEYEGAIGSIMDITGLIKAEEERLQFERQFLQAQKLESLGIMAGGIAHDFNNILQAILGNMELASGELTPGSDPQRLITNAIKAGRQAAHLTGLILAYTGRGYISKKEIDLNELVRGNADMLRTAATASVDVELRLSEELPSIMADEASVQQVVMNLIMNAAESIDDGTGVVRLTTGIQNCDQTCLAASLLAEKPAPGRFVFLEVEDNGCGMGEETMKRIFDPFFTTKFTGRGLGMSAVMGIVKTHEGALFLESEEGKGTNFRVLFPIFKSGKPAAPPEPIMSAENGTTGETPLSGLALLVDDEKNVLKTCSRMVKLCGFTVITATKGIEAVEKFRENADQIDVVLMDLTMPGMDGLEAMREIHGIRGDARVVIASGFNEYELSGRLTGRPPSGFIRKPYSMGELEKEMRRVMQGKK